MGLSRGRIDNAEGALEADKRSVHAYYTASMYQPADPPLPSLFIGIPPTAVCELPEPDAVAAVFDPPTFFM
jgi:hypothetical protein